MPAPHETFVACCQALWGTIAWASEASQALGVARRRIHYWASGAKPIPPGVWRDLRDLLARRQGELGALEAAVYANEVETTPAA